MEHAFSPHHKESSKKDNLIPIKANQILNDHWLIGYDQFSND